MVTGMLFSDENVNKNNKEVIRQKAGEETGDVVNTSGNDGSVNEKESEVLSLIILNEYDNDTEQKEINHISELACTLQEIQNLQNSLPVDSGETATAIVEETGEEIQVSTQHVLQLLQEQQNQHMQLAEALGNGQQNVLDLGNNPEEQQKLSQLLNMSCSSSGDKEELVHTSISPHIEHDGDTISLNIHSADATWIALLDKFEYLANEDRIRGYVEGEKMFLKLWETFQTSTMSTFTVRSSDKFYEKGSEGDPNTIHGRIIKGRALWKRRPLIPYDGVPFVQIDRKYFGCRLVYIKIPLF